MAQHFPIRVETAKAITFGQERELVRAALAQQPASLMLQQRLAEMFLTDDLFDEAISLLEKSTQQAPDITSFELLAQALLARETEADTKRAVKAASTALEMATHSNEKAHARATLGKAQARLGLRAEAQATLALALIENPQEKDAYKRLATLHFQDQRPEATLALADDLIAHGVGHSRLLASRTLALAQLGRTQEARDFARLADFHHREILSAPAGWPDLASFNQSLASEMLDHPALRFDRYGTASSKTWRVDEPSTGRAPLAAALQQHILVQVDAFVARISEIDHLWTRARPNKGLLHSWCVITDGEGFEEWHVHQNGWLSGVYYIAVPDSISAADTLDGCLAFGLPDDIVGAEAAAAFGLQIERPEPGLLMMFPSHTYHRTFAHGSDQRRICFAFDIWPERD